MSQIIEELESNVRSYCRSFPVTFDTAKGSVITDDKGNRYIDLFAGAGALNYGHNEPRIKQAVVDYMMRDGISHALDLTTSAKEEFLLAFSQKILQPRGLEYKVMFPGPTGTNAVESALKIARKTTGRREIIAFTNAFHGMTLGSLALTGNGGKRAGAGVPLDNVSRMPFCNYLGDKMDTLDYLDRLLLDGSSGVERPAAIIVETIQAEGGVNEASSEWLRRLQTIARRHGALFIVDDIQTGCGRTGTFFSFEKAELRPDIVCLSKSLSGYGLPFALTLMHPHLDVLGPGEHNGTFRGNNLAFVAGKRALELYWSDDRLEKSVDQKAELIADRLERIARSHRGVRKGRGFLQGIAFQDLRLAGAASKAAFERGVMIETSGANDEVLKVLCPLTIERELLVEALQRVGDAVSAAQARIDSQRAMPLTLNPSVLAS